MIIFISYFFCFTLDMKVRGLILSMGICKVTIFLILGYKVFYIFDWKEILDK